MKLIKWTDDTGRVHLSALCNDQPDEDAPRGIPYDPPEVDDLGLEPDQAQELHNTLIGLHLILWADVVARQNGVSSALRRLPIDDERKRSIKRVLIARYKLRR